MEEKTDINKRMGQKPSAERQSKPPQSGLFRNRYGITLAADLYEPKRAAGKLAAIAVCGGRSGQ